MKNVFSSAWMRVGVACVAMFLVGMGLQAAGAASHVNGYYKIFGHSTSCALGAVSINDSTNKGGSRTVNRVGCNVNNSARAVPPNYIGAAVYLQRMVDGSPIYYCSGFPYRYNSGTASAVEITATVTFNSACVRGGLYRSYGSNYRKSDSGDNHTIDIESGSYRLY